jgi:hypothetical protein
MMSVAARFVVRPPQNVNGGHVIELPRASRTIENTLNQLFAAIPKLSRCRGSSCLLSRDIVQVQRNGQIGRC